MLTPNHANISVVGNIEIGFFGAEGNISICEEKYEKYIKHL